MSFGDRPGHSEPPYMAWFHDDNTNALHESAQRIHETAATRALLDQSSHDSAGNNAPWALDLHARQLAVRESRFGSTNDTAQGLPDIGLDSAQHRQPAAVSAVAIAERPPEAAAVTVAARQAESSPVAEAPAKLERTAVQVADMEITQPLALNKEEKESRAWAQLKDLRSPNSATSQKLESLGLLQDFESNNCHEHLSWGADSVSVALKSENGYRRTICSYFDQTTSERATDPKGNLLYTLSRSGKLIDNSDRAAKLTV